MDSLTTAYLVCMLIGSLGSFAGSYAGNKMFPIESSVLVVEPEPAASVQTPEQPPAPSPQNTEQTQPAVPSVVV